MEEQIKALTAEEIPIRDKYSLQIFIAVAVIIAVNLVAISMAMYNSSGAAQLDLSRPGYVSVRSQAKSDDSLKVFSSYGTIDRTVIDEFKGQYDKQVNKVKAVDAFGGDPISPSSLGMEIVQQ